MKSGFALFVGLILLTILVCCLPENIPASESSGVSVGVTIPIIQAIELNPPVFIFPEIASTQLNQGYVEAIATATLTVSSNAAWQLSIRSEDQDMGKVDDYIKVLSDFLWRRSGELDYTAISLENQRVASSAAYADHDEIQLDYKMLVGWTRDKPGTYGLTLRFTLSTLE